MTRIPDDVIERLKTDVSVQRLAEARGVIFTRHGADLIGPCPFHEDKTPSLVVTPAKNSGTAWALSDRRDGDRLGDACGRRLLPACRGAAAE